MYRISDFHSDKAPKLKSSGFSFFGMFGEEDDDDDENNSKNGDNDDTIDPSIYEKFFHTKVGDEDIYIEHPLDQNEAGWTPLHACCMSFQMVPTGERLIDLSVKESIKNLDYKTTNGPGNFNASWTALHMAAAYGVEPLVLKLCDAGADVNTKNNFGYTPLLEACHRGFVNIVKKLVEYGADTNYIPSQEIASKSPFVNAPPQAALGESARFGSEKIVTLLLEMECDKNQCNSIGWTALHEACFYNRLDTVKLLLIHGCDASIRTKSGALPYHLAGIGAIKSMIADMGSEGSVPAKDDIIDMVSILKELTLPASELDEEDDIDGWGIDFAFNLDEDDDEDDEEEYQKETEALRKDLERLSNAIAGMDDNMDGLDHDINKMIENDANNYSNILDGNNINNMNTPQAKRLNPTPTLTDGSKDIYDNDLRTGDEKIVPMIDRYPNGTPTTNNADSKSELLHSGPMLGDLPSLGGTPGSSGMNNNSNSGTKKGKLSPEQIRAGQGLQAVLASDGASDGSPMMLSTEERERFLREARRKHKVGGKKKKKKNTSSSSSSSSSMTDAPPEFLCALSKQIMSDPVRSSSGVVFDRLQIVNWIQHQGHICPISGSPLSENELISMDTLKNKIQMWILKKSQQPSSNEDNDVEGVGVGAEIEDSDVMMPGVASPKSKITGSINNIGGSAVVGSLGASTYGGNKNDTNDNDDDLYEF